MGASKKLHAQQGGIKVGNTKRLNGIKEQPLPNPPLEERGGDLVISRLSLLYVLELESGQKLHAQPFPGLKSGIKVGSTKRLNGSSQNHNPSLTLPFEDIRGGDL
ncbi:hypothetical protein A8139_06830 [Marinomonas primoryensis]|uniref:Uncharacterized protein n=1 Tax=Marinomonas primoryensis TaxID=178399 RepID=A0A2Z4PQJ7_9GAMM|nr:hypothetical protein A8139_06830 [Marinomonas primoryensis]